MNIMLRHNHAIVHPFGVAKVLSRPNHRFIATALAASLVVAALSLPAKAFPNLPILDFPDQTTKAPDTPTRNCTGGQQSCAPGN